MSERLGGARGVRAEAARGTAPCADGVCAAEERADVGRGEAACGEGTLRAFQALCSFCAWALYDDPDPATLADLADRCAMFVEAPFSQVAPQAAGDLARILGDAEAGGDDAWQAFLDGVRRDRSYLFYMVGASKTSPYESVYRTDDATMFGPATLEVRAAYADAGLAFARRANEPEDHAGLEFSFAAHLLGRAAEGDVGAKAALGRFLRDHLLVFGPIYLGNLGTRAKTPYYASIAGIADATLAALADELGEACDGADEA